MSIHDAFGPREPRAHSCTVALVLVVNIRDPIRGDFPCLYIDWFFNAVSWNIIIHVSFLEFVCSHALLISCPQHLN